MRSRSHRVLVATHAGVGASLVFQSVASFMASGNRTWWQSPQGPLLPAPLILALFLLAGLRYAFSLPAEWRANWAFQIAGIEDTAGLMKGVRKAVMLFAIVPLFAALLPVHVALWGWTAGGLHIAYGATVAWLLMEAILLGMDKVPFTCSNVPGKTDLRSTWPLFAFGYLAYVSVFSWVEYRIQARPARMVWFMAFAVLAKAGVEWRRRNQAADFALQYDERPEPAVRTLGLQE